MSIQAQIQELQNAKTAAYKQLATKRPDLVPRYSNWVPGLAQFPDASLSLIHLMATAHLASMKTSLESKESSRRLLERDVESYPDSVEQARGSIEACDAEISSLQRRIESLENLNAKVQLNQMVENANHAINLANKKIPELTTLANAVPSLHGDVLNLVSDYL